MNKILVLLEGENPEDHNFIRMKIQWLKHEMRSINMGMKGSVMKKITKEEMEKNNVSTCYFWQSPW